jgi:hypothetical protein
MVKSSPTVAVESQLWRLKRYDKKCAQVTLFKILLESPDFRVID